MKREQAETVAIQALGWIAGEDDLLVTFLGATGSDVDDVKERAGDAVFLGSVLDFLLMDDAFVTGFCDAQRLPYETPMQARQALPGGDIPNWT